jgi:hypothetical protein
MGATPILFSDTTRFSPSSRHNVLQLLNSAICPSLDFC